MGLGKFSVQLHAVLSVGSLLCMCIVLLRWRSDLFSWGGALTNPTYGHGGVSLFTSVGRASSKNCWLNGMIQAAAKVANLQYLLEVWDGRHVKPIYIVEAQPQLEIPSIFWELCQTYGNMLCLPSSARIMSVTSETQKA
eukprot:568065-Amphidinium_carterae.2